jgi:multidrug efflux pump subunit AcrA (membrane-fusion protein)
VRIGASIAATVLVALAGCRATIEESAEPPVAPAIVTVAAVGRGDVDETIRASGETSALKVLRLASPVAGRLTFLTVQTGDRLAAGEVAARVLPLESETAVVAERAKNPGEQVAPGDAILELFDPRSLVTIAQVPIDVVPKLRKGMPVTVHTASGSTRGAVDVVQTSLAATTLTVPVRILFASPLEPPLRGAAVDCEILLSTRRGALLVPRAALVARTARNAATVVVAEDGHAHVRAIETGIRSGDRVEVVSGLRVGEEIVVQGQYGLPDGAPIRVSAPETGPTPDAE